MVFPLFVIALVWGKYHSSEGHPLHGTIINMKFFGREFSAHSSKLIAGLMFLVMGVVNAGVGLSGGMIPAPGSAMVGALLAQFQKGLITSFSMASPESSALIGIAALASIFLVLTYLRQTKHLRETTQMISD